MTDIYCVAHRKESRLGSCGIFISHMDELERVQTRKFGYVIYNSDLELIEIQAVRLAMASLILRCFSDKITIHTESKSLADLLTDSESKPEMYSKQIDSLRDWLRRCKNLSVVRCADDDALLEEARKLALQVSITGKNFDSKTIQVPV